MNYKTLSALLANADSLDWQTALYLPVDKSRWGLDCVAIVENPDGFDDYDGDDNPVELSKLHYRYVIQCDDVQSVVLNLREQCPAFDLDLAYKAFIYYLEHDAFIRIGQNRS